MTGVTQTAANASTATTATMGTATASMSLFGWISSNSVLIGVGCTILSLIVAYIFHLLNLRINEKYKRIDSIAAMKSQGLSDEEIENIFKLSEET